MTNLDTAPGVPLSATPSTPGRVWHAFRDQSREHPGQHRRKHP